MTCSCPSVKGYVTKKSTAFSPNGAKYGIQSMVHNHMMAHYRLIDNAKSSIDNKPPKSINKFIKAQPKKSAIRRNKPSKKVNESSVNGAFVSLSTKKDDRLEEFEKEILDSDVIFSPKKKHAYFSSDESETSIYSSPTNMYPSHSLEEEFLKRNMPNANYRMSSPLNKSFIHKRSDSSISYRKPLNFKRETRTSTPTYLTEMFVPEKPLGKLQGSSMNQHDYKIHIGNDVKKLSSTYNNDLLKKSFSSVNQNVSRNSSSDTLDFSKRNLKNSLSQNNRSFQDAKMNQSYQKLKEQESLIAEEQMYLNFIEDVTNDILVRGIFSDRVLCHVFEVHIAKNKGILNEERMYDLIEELKQDLGVSMEESPSNIFRTPKKQSSDYIDEKEVYDRSLTSESHKPVSTSTSVVSNNSTLKAERKMMNNVMMDNTLNNGLHNLKLDNCDDSDDDGNDNDGDNDDHDQDDVHYNYNDDDDNDHNHDDSHYNDDNDDTDNDDHGHGHYNDDEDDTDYDDHDHDHGRASDDDLGDQDYEDKSSDNHTYRKSIGDGKNNDADDNIDDDVSYDDNIDDDNSDYDDNSVGF